MTEPVADVLYRVQQANRHLGGLLLELLNDPDPDTQTAQLRDLGRYLGSLSAECPARAAELDGRCGEPCDHVIIDATGDPP